MMKWIFIFALSLLAVTSKAQTDSIDEQPFTEVGPSAGLLSFQTNYSWENPSYFGITVRRTNKWLYIQPEVNMVYSPAYERFTQLRVPITLGLRIMRVVRIYGGTEFRNNLIEIRKPSFGPNYYIEEEQDNYLYPKLGWVTGMGISLLGVNLDFRYVSDFENKFPQYSMSAAYLFKLNK